MNAETGLPYHRARYYDPQLGRVLGEDPIRLEGGINLYAYVGNAPVDVDRGGLLTGILQGCAGARTLHV